MNNFLKNNNSRKKNNNSRKKNNSSRKRNNNSRKKNNNSKNKKYTNGHVTKKYYTTGGMESYNSTLEEGGMESHNSTLEEEPIFPLGITVSNRLEIPIEENSICIDIQGITATPTNLATGFLGPAYSTEGRNFFNQQAPGIIAEKLEEYQNIYILWQGDKDFDGKVSETMGCNIYTGIGTTISRLHQILSQNGKNVKIICISKKKECKDVANRLSILKDIELELIDNDIISSISSNDFDKWRKELIRYYGGDIINWGKWNGSGRRDKISGELNKNDRIENLIKQYISNLTSIKTYILEYGFNDSISAYFNEEKKEKENVIHINITP